MNFLLIFTLIGVINSFNIDCDFSRYDRWTVLDVIYYCAVINDVTNDEPSAAITQVTGTHEDEKNIKDVVGFWVENTQMKHFPKHLEHYFQNLIAIGFENSGMKEIHKEDLQPFGDKLEFFRLSGTDLEVIEKDLFKYNPNLKVIGLQRNNIKSIDEHVFDHLNSLQHLWLTCNVCIKNDAGNSVEVAKIIQEVKSKCSETEPSCEDLKRENERMKIILDKLNLVELYARQGFIDKHD